MPGHRVSSPMRKSLPVIVIAAASMLGACGFGSRGAFYSFEYDTAPSRHRGFPPDTELLEFRFGEPGDGGEAKSAATWPYSDHIPQSTTIAGYMRIRGTIYAKWKSLASGKVSAATAHFADRLPRDISHCTVYFTTYGNRLTVFLITTVDEKSAPVPDRPLLAQHQKTIVLYQSAIPADLPAAPPMGNALEQ